MGVLLPKSQGNSEDCELCSVPGASAREEGQVLLDPQPHSSALVDRSSGWVCCTRSSISFSSCPEWLHTGECTAPSSHCPALLSLEPPPPTVPTLAQLSAMEEALVPVLCLALSPWISRERAVGPIKAGVFVSRTQEETCFSTMALSPAAHSTFRDAGLEQFDTVSLFTKILLPAAFLLVCILQLHYFNEDFLKTTSLHNIPIQ
ncbi:Piezo-type mechanosensitive ion channel component 2 [Plecturocebus cupreus]